MREKEMNKLPLQWTQTQCSGDMRQTVNWLKVGGFTSMVPPANSVLGSTKGIECINGGQKICKPKTGFQPSEHSF